MARKFVLITDTGSDLPAEYYTQHDIDCIKLGFTLDGETYGEDGGEMDVKKFYELLRNGAMPKTFQITPAQAIVHIEPFAKEGKDVLIVAFSSGLSGTYESYLAAAKEIKASYPNVDVRVVDSLCASLGQGLFVDYVVRKADTGATLEETVAYAEDLKWHICHYFTVDDLFHLKRGGRVSGATAAIEVELDVQPPPHPAPGWDAALDNWFHVQDRPGRIAVTGSNARSVLLGAYRLLHHLGCRFLMPGRRHEAVPALRPEDPLVYFR